VERFHLQLLVKSEDFFDAFRFIPLFVECMVIFFYLQARSLVTEMVSIISKL
jgi:hypothetical protein